MDVNLENAPYTPWQWACRALAMGQVIAHPTETLFGLAVDPFNPVAVQRLLRLKGRNAGKGFILLVPDRERALALIEPPSPLAQRLMTDFWPGPLTLVLPARSGLPAVVTGGSGFVALRHSSSPLVAQLLHGWQKPLVSTSANPSGHAPACSAEEVRRYWGKAIAVVLEGSTAKEALPSTVVQVKSGEVRVLREGVISMAALQAKIPEITQPPRTIQETVVRPAE